MANPLGAQVQCSPDRLRRPGLARMRRQSQSVIGSIRVDAAEKFRRSLDFVAANADSDDVPIPVASCEFEDSLCLLDSEVACGVENPQQRYAEIACAAGPSAVQAFED